MFLLADDASAAGRFIVIEIEISDGSSITPPWVLTASNFLNSVFFDTLKLKLSIKGSSLTSLWLVIEAIEIVCGFLVFAVLMSAADG